jgi:beta-phosphoglucomutase-like phosphatase (HAD superfamily)
MPDAVIFDLDGVLMDSEQRWNEAKEALVRETGGRWRDHFRLVKWLHPRRLTRCLGPSPR